MFSALEPVFHAIYDRLNTQFGETGQCPEFKTFEKGLQLKQEREIDAGLFPWGFLEWGTVGEVSFAWAPRTAEYRITYPLILLTLADQGQQERLIFNPTNRLLRTGETVQADFEDGEVGIFSDTLLISANSIEASAFTELDTNDRIILRPTSGDDITCILARKPIASIRDGISIVEIPLTDITGGMKNQSYTVIVPGNTNLGIGDLVETVGGYLCRHLEAGFLLPDEKPRGLHFSKWTINRIVTPTIAAVRPLLENPFIRAAQIEIDVTIQEKITKNLA